MMTNIYAVGVPNASWSTLSPNTQGWSENRTNNFRITSGLV